MEQRGRSLVAEFLDFFSANRKWWAACIAILLLLLGILVLLGNNGAAPFIYTLY